MIFHWQTSLHLVNLMIPEGPFAGVLLYCFSRAWFISIPLPFHLVWWTTNFPSEKWSQSSGNLDFITIQPSKYNGTQRLYLVQLKKKNKGIARRVVDRCKSQSASLCDRTKSISTDTTSFNKTCQQANCALFSVKSFLKVSYWLMSFHILPSCKSQLWLSLESCWIKCSGNVWYYQSRL